ncbi:MAG TPA: hypothetical protein VN699_11085 [Pirellulales bacterium]|nr:hypothetical protein [Pirellulales bacterium]
MEVNPFPAPEEEQVVPRKPFRLTPKRLSCLTFPETMVLLAGQAFIYILVALLSLTLVSLILAGAPFNELHATVGSLVGNIVLAAVTVGIILVGLRCYRMVHAEMLERKQEVIDALIAVGFGYTGQEAFKEVSGAENLRRGELLVRVHNSKVTIIRCRPDGTKLSRPYMYLFSLVDTAKILEMVTFLDAHRDYFVTVPCGVRRPSGGR